ncbi:ABC transporter permease subunit [Sporolactobacillus sp. THM19-2]|uniref:ABC transporter permease subunit n=1 Tax=Sporolactobacillus sp. THM19-2 TaxID=2511171 RepID=UPI00101F7119|nr:ABC transporter permease subunit [Sporolactobacillus sp. THM19-2]RYL90931.1 ABC transporter permease [Sporolactobacillus sp. THM19-2]
MTLFRLESKTHIKSLLIWVIVVVALIFGMMALFPSMRDSMASFDMSAFPKEMLEAFNLSDMAVLGTAEGFFGYYFQYILIASAIFAAMLGTNALAREESDGTIGYLYAQPISRASIVSSKILANALVYTLYWVVTVVASFLICLLFLEEGASASEVFKDFSVLLFAGEVMGLTFLSVGILISSLLASSKSTTSISLALVFLTYILGIVGRLQADYEFLVYFSPVDTALPSNVFNHGIEWKYVITDLIVLAVCFLATYWIYRRKDLKA